MRKIATAKRPSELLLDLMLMLYETPRGSNELAYAVGELRAQEVPLATFYRQLQRSVDEGWVEMCEGRATTMHGPGRPERVYRITDSGARMLRYGIEEQRRRVARAGALGLLTEQCP